ncbi:MAG TPA: dihydrofolate reductase family protein [Chloroflexia bacterium]|nr:dihydrofolate reductase family protein [Chloroflexia bacterium]
MMQASTAATLAPFQTLYDASPGDEMPLPPELSSIYGPLRMPSHAGRPHVIGNLVASLDGVVSLGIPGKEGGKAISGANEHDRALMGILRATADAIIMGAGTLRTAPHHMLTPEYAHPPMGDAYGEFRAALGKPGPPLSVIVSATGDIEPNAALFETGAPVLVVTTTAGQARLGKMGLPPWVRVEVPEGAQERNESKLTAQGMLRAARDTPGGSGGVVLVEGGPHLIGNFFGDGCLDEMFLTLSPQVVGRDGSAGRPGLVEGRSLAPEHPAWGTLVGVRRAGSHLFLRYRFGA